MADDLYSLRQHRQLKGFTIRSLAAQSGVATQTIVKIEQGGRARPSTFHRLAETLGIETAEIREFMELVLAED